MAARTASRRLSRDLVAVGSVVAWAICAQAQEKPRGPTKSDEKVQEVVITGSRIARPDLECGQPATGIRHRAELRRSVLTRLAANVDAHQRPPLRLLQHREPLQRRHRSGPAGGPERYSDEVDRSHRDGVRGRRADLRG